MFSLSVHTELKYRLLFKNVVSGKEQEKSFPSSKEVQEVFGKVFSHHSRKKNKDQWKIL